MKEFVQAACFYRSLDEDEKKDLAETIAADIIFFDDDMQRSVIELLQMVDSSLAKHVAEINNFTI